jgi:uroporphyrinogen-III synthase
LSRTRIVVRGPTPVRALREVGLAPSIVAAAPTTDGVIASLRTEPLQGKTVGVQLYSESNPPLVEFLVSAGAAVRTVQPYVYAPAADADGVVDLIRRLNDAAVDALVFTSSPQVDRLFEVAGERQLEASLREGLTKTCVAVVGPVVADNLRERGIDVDVMPPQGFVMKNLVQHLKRRFAGA